MSGQRAEGDAPTAYDPDDADEADFLGIPAPKCRRVRVVRVRLPRDRSFLYARLGPAPDGFVLDVRLIRRRYHSPKRIEFMNLSTLHGLAGDPR